MDHVISTEMAEGGGASRQRQLISDKQPSHSYVVWLVSVNFIDKS